MTADASIYGLLKPATPIADPLESYAKVQNLRSLMGQNQLHQLQTDKLIRDQATEDATNSVLKNAPTGATLESLLPEMMKVNPSAGLKFQQQILEQKAKQATINKDNATAGHTQAQTNDINSGQLAGAYAALAKMGGSDDAVRQIESQFSSLIGPEKAAAISSQLLALPPELRLPYVTAQAGKHKTGQEALKLFFKDAHMQDAGGQVVPVNTSTLPGAPAPGSLVAGGIKVPKQDLRSDLVMIGPDGVAKPNQPVIAAKSAIQKAGANNITINTEKTYAGKLAGSLADMDAAALDAARSAPQRITTARSIKQILDAGNVTTGTAAESRLALNKALATAGIIDGSNVKNTEDLASLLGSSTLDAIKSSGLGSGPGFTDNDRKFLERARSGNIEINAGTLRRLADLNEKAGIAAIEAGNKVAERVKNDPNFGTVGRDLHVPMPAATGVDPSAVDAALKKHLPGAK